MVFHFLARPFVCPSVFRVMSNITSTCREVAVECSTADAVLLREKQDMLGKRWRSLLSGLAAVRQRYVHITLSICNITTTGRPFSTTVDAVAAFKTVNNKKVQNHTKRKKISFYYSSSYDYYYYYNYFQSMVESNGWRIMLRIILVSLMERTVRYGE